MGTGGQIHKRITKMINKYTKKSTPYYEQMHVKQTLKCQFSCLTSSQKKLKNSQWRCREMTF